MVPIENYSLEQTSENNKSRLQGQKTVGNFSWRYTLYHRFWEAVHRETCFKFLVL